MRNIQNSQRKLLNRIVAKEYTIFRISLKGVETFWYGSVLNYENGIWKFCNCIYNTFKFYLLVWGYPSFQTTRGLCHRSSAHISCRHSSHFVFIYICHIHFYGLILYEEEWIRVAFPYNIILYLGTAYPIMHKYVNTPRNGFKDKDL